MTQPILPEWFSEWTEYDADTMSLQLKPDAPDEVKEEWNRLMELVDTIDDD